MTLCNHDDVPDLGLPVNELNCMSKQIPLNWHQFDIEEQSMSTGCDFCGICSVRR